MAADNDHPERIFLIGPMGAGKSTVARQLAQRLDMDCLDTDRAIEQRAGVDIATIFDFEGESGFRRREAAMIDELTRHPRAVVATGGGAILDPANRQLLRERGLVVYLATPIGEQLRRTRHDRQRPLLQTDDRRATLQRLHDERDPLYRSIAAVIVNTGRRRSSATVDHVLQQIHAQR